VCDCVYVCVCECVCLIVSLSLSLYKTFKREKQQNQNSLLLLQEQEQEEQAVTCDAGGPFDGHDAVHQPDVGLTQGYRRQAVQLLQERLRHELQLRLPLLQFGFTVLVPPTAFLYHRLCARSRCMLLSLMSVKVTNHVNAVRSVVTGAAIEQIACAGLSMQERCQNIFKK